MFIQRLIVGFNELLHATCCFFLQTFYTSANLSLGDRNPRPIPFTQSLSKGATNGIIGKLFFRISKHTCCRCHRPPCVDSGMHVLNTWKSAQHACCDARFDLHTTTDT